MNLTIEEVVYWAALAGWYTHNAPATQTIIRAYYKRDHSLLARLERVHIFAAMLLRQARRLVLERIAELEKK